MLSLPLSISGGYSAVPSSSYDFDVTSVTLGAGQEVCRSPVVLLPRGAIQC